jgi:hypothetical protein
MGSKLVMVVAMGYFPASTSSLQWFVPLLILTPR